MASFIVYGDASGQVTVKAPDVAGSNTITFPAETGTLITSAYTGAALPGQIAWNTSVQTTGFTAVANAGYFCNTTGGAFTVTLPATPTRGQFVVIVDYAGTAATNNITVAPNGSKINGGSSKLLQTNRQGITFTYIDSTQGWLATSNVYGGSTPFINAPYSGSYLVVAGGGGGSYSGGGAGGLISGSLTLTPLSVYTVVVGAGGTASSGTSPTSTGVAPNGNDSSLTGVTTAIGGGGAGDPKRNLPASPGGSGGGGGGGNANGAGGSGTPGQGNPGGNGVGSNVANGGMGGGGGAGGAGGNATAPTSGGGGVGVASSITGTPDTYAGGGSGWTSNPTGYPGGGGYNGVPAVNYKGGGGGGGSAPLRSGGGIGVVYLSVPTTNYTGITTGSPTITTAGSNTIMQFTSSGSYTA